MKQGKDTYQGQPDTGQEQRETPPRERREGLKGSWPRLETLAIVIAICSLVISIISVSVSISASLSAQRNSLKMLSSVVTTQDNRVSSMGSEQPQSFDGLRSDVKEPD